MTIAYNKTKFHCKKDAVKDSQNSKFTRLHLKHIRRPSNILILDTPLLRTFYTAQQLNYKPDRIVIVEKDIETVDKIKKRRKHCNIHHCDLFDFFSSAGAGQRYSSMFLDTESTKFKVYLLFKHILEHSDDLLESESLIFLNSCCRGFLGRKTTRKYKLPRHYTTSHFLSSINSLLRQFQNKLVIKKYLLPATSTRNENSVGRGGNMIPLMFYIKKL